jgi:hypothetical protein
LSDHKGYRCLDLHSNLIIISRHVVLDETVFPFADMSTSAQDPTTIDFLDDVDDFSLPNGSRAVHAGSHLPSSMDAAPRQLAIDGSYQSLFGFASGQIPRRSQGTLLPLSVRTQGIESVEQCAMQRLNLVRQEHLIFKRLLCI